MVVVMLLCPSASASLWETEMMRQSCAGSRASASAMQLQSGQKRVSKESAEWQLLPEQCVSGSQRTRSPSALLGKRHIRTASAQRWKGERDALRNRRGRTGEEEEGCGEERLWRGIWREQL